MKTIFSLLLMCSSFLLLATPNPTNGSDMSNRFDIAEDNISSNLNELNEINQILINENLSFESFVSKYPELQEKNNLSASANEGLFDSNPDSPLGIAGFWWGLVLGCLGMLVVYFAMDSGEDRKEQFKSAAIGCLISSLLGGALWWQVF